MTIRFSRSMTVVFVALAMLAIAAPNAPAAAVGFEEALRAVPVTDLDRFVAALELGAEQPDFPATETLQLIQRVSAAAGPAGQKEAVLFHLVVALEEGLPIDTLVAKALEGLARGVALDAIERSLGQRSVLLVETRDLFYSEGIFSVSTGTTPPVPTALPASRFNLLVTHISDTLADYLEGGNSPFEGQTMYQEVRFRLLSLAGATLNAEDVDLVLKRVEPADMTRVALSAVS